MLIIFPAIDSRVIFLYLPQMLRLSLLKINKLKTFLRPLRVSHHLKDKIEKMFNDKLLFLNKVQINIPLPVFSILCLFPKCWLKLASKIPEDTIVRLEECLQQLLNSCLCLYRNLALPDYFGIVSEDVAIVL